MSDRSSPGAEERVVVEIQKRGKLVVGEPFFTPGVPLVLDRKGLADAGPGDLALVRKGRGRARVARVLGPARSIDAALDGLLAERGLGPPAEPYRPPEPSLDGRVDLRDLLSFTIDPETAKDFDDALSVRREADGLRAWVHIADVSYFVTAGSPLDHGAADRATSVYVPGRVAPMLPHELADDLCSLRAGVDRSCVTVELPPRGEPLFYRSTIRSRRRLTYGEVERILAGTADAGDADLLDALRATDGLARELRSARFARGALRIESPEVVFAFDGRGGVERAWREHEPHAHALVEELMIRANEAVAQLLAGRRRETLYRVHERPDPQAIGLLLARLADLDVPTPPAPEADRMTPSEAAALAGAVSDGVADYVARARRGRDAFPQLVLRSLKQARYHPENLGHSGLASPAYCHFTSPIRRYPDLVCHRALLRELGAADDPPAADLDELAEHTSAQERAAAQVEYLGDELCLAWLLERQLFDRGWEAPWEGEIVSVIGSGLFVRFGDVFEGFVPARRLAGDYFELSPLATALVGRRSGTRFRLGDGIRVRVEEIRRSEGKVELSPAE
jgi:ribonuclease R